MKTKIVLLVSLGSLISCGPSQEQIQAREKQKMDSVAAATQAQIEHEKAVQDSIAADDANQEILKNQLVELKASLEAERSKLNDIEQFKLLRTADEKSQQVSDQTKVIEELKLQIEEIEKKIRR